MRRAANVDNNQAAITRALRQVGATVQPLHMVGRGVPDLLVGHRGSTYLLEIKDGSKPPSKRRLTPDEQSWHETWRGGCLAVVASVDEALRAIGAVESEGV